MTIGEHRHFRCHVGHAFSLDSLLGEQGEDLERALWAAVRSLEESAALSHHLMQQADVIRRILLRGEPTLEVEPAAGGQPPEP